jgi:hypothetical protein
MIWNPYVTPFSYGMWLAVAMAACVLGVCLALTNFSNNSKQRLSLIETVFYIPSCFCQQGKKVKLLYELFIHSFMLCLLDIFFHICVVMWDISSIHSRPHIHSKPSTDILNLYDFTN